MRGYGVLGNIGKFLLPIAKNLASSISEEGITAGTRILKDVNEGKSITYALKEHSKKGLENLAGKIQQCGKGKTQKKTKQQQSKRHKSMISMYPPRPDSPTPTSSAAIKKRKRKLDQLDIVF